MFSSGAKLTETGEGGVNGAHVPKHVSKENNPELVNVIALLQSMEGENVKEKLMKIKSATTKSLAQVCIKALIRSGQKSELPKRFYLRCSLEFIFVVFISLFSKMTLLVLGVLL